MNTKINNKVIENFIERRKGDDIANSTINAEINILIEFKNWYSDNNIEYFNYEVIDCYLNTLEYRKEKIRKTKCTLFRLYDYILNNKYSIITTRDETIILNSDYKNYFSEYISVINDCFDKTTINNKKVFLKHFLNFLAEKKITNLFELKQQNVTEFLNNMISKYSKAYFYKIAYFTREYINYLFNNGLITFDGYSVIPKLNACYGTPIPTTYTNEEISKMLLAVDRTTKVGKRDYLILLLLAIYGIRIGDICNMKLSSLNLANNKLRFTQKKTNKILELPLIDEVKYAFLDYHKNARPQLKSDYLFITFTKPYRNYDKRGFRNIVPTYLKIANINTEGKKKGAHSLRHSLASNMLLNGSNIKQISDILGHTYISTSNQYLTIDLMKLQELSLELPTNCVEIGDCDE